MNSETWYWEKTWNGPRSGATPIVMTWEGGEAEIALYIEGVPKTTQTFLASLPLEIPVVHVAWSGEMVMSARPVPLGIAEEENRTRLMRPGDLAYDPKYNEITVTYGTAEARLPSGPNTLTVIGNITSGLAEFSLWARARRFEGVGMIKLRAI